MRSSFKTAIRHSRIFTLSVVITLLTTTLLPAAEHYVSINGTGAGGAWSTAYTSLQDALDVAVSNDNIYVAGHTFNLDSEVSWNNSGVTVRGGYAATNDNDNPGPSDPDRWPTVLTRSGVASHRILHISGATNSSLENATLTGGNIAEGAGVYIEQSRDIVLSGCIITNNAFSVNSPEVTGGGIRAYDSELTLTNCFIARNTIRQTGAAGGKPSRGAGIWSDGTLTIRNSEIAHNTVLSASPGEGQGGGIWFEGDRLDVRQSVIRGNSAVYAGGGMYCNAGTSIVQHVRFEGNSAEESHGGSVYLNADKLEMKNTILMGSFAGSYGAGLYAASGSAVLRNCNVVENSGDGIYRNSATVQVTNSIVWGNWNDIDGAATVWYSNIGESGYEGVNGNIRADPLFEYGYYLSSGSPCINAGTGTVADAGLTGYTTQTDGSADTDRVDMGYHHASGFDVTYADLYVAPAPQGDDGNDGTSWVEAFATVTKALDTALNGSRIHVTNGTYSQTSGEIFPLSISSRPGLQILGSGSAETIFDADGAGAGVMSVSASHRALVQDVLITGGSIPNGAGLNIDSSQDFVVSGCVVSNNAFVGNYISDFSGGGIYASRSEVTLTNCTVTGNTAENNGNNENGKMAQGGGIWSDGMLTVRDSDIVENTARATKGHVYGGGIYASGKSLNLYNVLLSKNESIRTYSTGDSLGGGLYCEAADALIEHVRITANMAQDTEDPGGTEGGGVYLNGGSLDMQNVLLSGNVGEYEHGAGLAAAGGTAVLRNCSVVDQGGEGIYVNGGAVIVSNSIVWGNWDEIEGSATVWYSTIGQDGYEGVNGNIRADPLFEHGYYLGSGSPCKDAGTGTVADAGLTGYTTQTDGSADTDRVDMGYHHASGFDVTYADLYVAPAPQGDDGNDGTSWVEAFATVTKALDTALDGTRIHVAAGVYGTAAETFPLRATDLLGVQILGSNAAKTVFDAESSTRVMTFERSHRSLLRDITLTGGNLPDGSGLHIDQSQGVLLSGCVISNNSFAVNATISGGGGLFANGSHVTVTNCIVAGNTAQQTGGASAKLCRGGGIWSDGVLKVRDSVVIDNTVLCANAGDGFGAGIWFQGGRLNAENVLIAGNSANNAGDGVYISAAEAGIRSCTIADNDGEGVQSDLGTVTLLNSVVWSNGNGLVGDFANVTYSNIEGTEVAAGEGNLNADPLFADAEADDYRLQPGSPSVGTGLIEEWMVGATDLAGNPRLSMGGVDMGCYQTQAPSGILIIIK